MKKIFAILLTACIVVGLAPAAAFAQEGQKAIQLVSAANKTGGITSQDYVYFGNWANQGAAAASPLKWRVLDTKTNMKDAKEGDGLFLLSDELLGDSSYTGGVYFQNSFKSNFSEMKVYKDDTFTSLMNEWPGSDAQKWCRDFSGQSGNTKEYTLGSFAAGVPSAFSAQEAAALMALSKDDDAYTCTYTYPTAQFVFSYEAASSILSGDKVFFLSAEEADTYFPKGVDGNDDRKASGTGDGTWWLRSASEQNITNYDGDASGVVHSSGGLGQKSIVGVTAAARPAFNINLNAVLFASAAAGGKTSAVGSLLEIPATTTNEWKLTIKDPAREGFSAKAASASSAAALPGESISLEYSGAKSGANEYVSVILADSSGNALYYGRLANNSESGTVSMAIPAELPTGSYTLKVFSEQDNGDEQTDYASPFSNVPLTISQPSAAHPPQTGDHSPVALWFALTCASCAGILAFAVCSKKRRTE